MHLSRHVGIVISYVCNSNKEAKCCNCVKIHMSSKITIQTITWIRVETIIVREKAEMPARKGSKSKVFSVNQNARIGVANVPSNLKMPTPRGSKSKTRMGS